MAATVAVAACGASSVDSVTLDTSSKLAPTAALSSTGSDAALKSPAQTVTGTVGSTTSQPVVAARRAAQSYATAVAPGGASYRIGPLDVVEVSVFKVPELSKVLQVSETGAINFPLIGDVSASGKTSRELELELARVLGEKYLQNPQIGVIVKEFNSQKITVEGEVKKPGVFPLPGNGVTLLQSIALAQGLSDLNDGDVVVFRVENGKRAAARFSISELRGGSVSDPKLQPNDVVVVGTSAIKESLSWLRYIPLTSIFALL